MSQDEPARITRTPSEINGVAVIAIEQALAAHPHPSQGGRLVPFRGVYKVLLEDGTETYLCAGTEDSACDRTDRNPKAIASHRSGSHPNSPRAKSQYPEETIKQVVLEVERAKRDGIRGYAAAAAQALNGRRISTAHGEPWTTGSVSHLYRRWRGHIKIRVPRPSTPTQRAAQRVREVAAANGHVEGLQPGDLESLQVFIKIVGPGPLGDALQRLLDLASQRPTLEVVDKARRYDELQALLGQR